MATNVSAKLVYLTMDPTLILIMVVLDMVSLALIMVLLDLILLVLVSLILLMTKVEVVVVVEVLLRITLYVKFVGKRGHIPMLSSVRSYNFQGF